MGLDVCRTLKKCILLLESLSLAECAAIMTRLEYQTGGRVRLVNHRLHILSLISWYDHAN